MTTSVGFGTAFSCREFIRWGIAAAIALALLLSVTTTEARILSSLNQTDKKVLALMDAGKRSEYGVGAKQDLEKAIRFYCEAAHLGDAQAMYHLGRIYSTGRAGKVDEILAAAWFVAAGKKQHPTARAWLPQLEWKLIELDQQPECKRPSDIVATRFNAPSYQSTGLMLAKNPGRKALKALTRRLAPEYGLDPELAIALVQAESNFDPKALSGKNAQGLMQLIPATAARFAVRDVWDPEQNLRGGMAYLKWLVARFDGNRALAVAAYNAGEGAVKRYGGIPPYPETQKFVKKVLNWAATAGSTVAVSRDSTGPGNRATSTQDAVEASPILVVHPFGDPS